MKKLLSCLSAFALVFAFACCQPAEAADIKIGLGGGVAMQDIEPAGVSGLEPEGYYIEFNLLVGKGLILRGLYSQTDDAMETYIGEGFLCEDYTLSRTAFEVGWLFNDDGFVRPFIHGGVALVDVEDDFSEFFEEVDERLKDDDFVPTYGVGLEVGEPDGHHTFIFDLSKDVDVAFTDEAAGYDVDTEFDTVELRLGYLYRF